MLISTANAEPGSAEDVLALSEILDDAASKPCLEELGKDAKKVIVIIEEPLFSQGTTEPDNNGFEYRSCFRNTFEFSYTDLAQKDKKKGQVLAELTKECSNAGQAAVKNSKYKDYQPRFSCREVQAILCNKGGTCMLYGYLTMIYKWGASMVGIIAVTVIVISGIQISAGGGDPEAVTSAKNRIIKSLAGIAVLFLSGLILYTVNPTFYTN